MSDAPQRRQYFLVGRFALPHLAHVLKFHHPQVIALPSVGNEYCKGFLRSIHAEFVTKVALFAYVVSHYTL